MRVIGLLLLSTSLAFGSDVIDPAGRDDNNGRDRDYGRDDEDDEGCGCNGIETYRIISCDPDADLGWDSIKEAGSPELDQTFLIDDACRMNFYDWMRFINEKHPNCVLAAPEDRHQLDYIASLNIYERHILTGYHKDPLDVLRCRRDPSRCLEDWYNTEGKKLQPNQWLWSQFMPDSKGSDLVDSLPVEAAKMSMSMQDPISTEKLATIAHTGGNGPSRRYLFDDTYYAKFFYAAVKCCIGLDCFDQPSPKPYIPDKGTVYDLNFYAIARFPIQDKNRGGIDYWMTPLVIQNCGPEYVYAENLMLAIGCGNEPAKIFTLPRKRLSSCGAFHITIGDFLNGYESLFGIKADVDLATLDEQPWCTNTAFLLLDGDYAGPYVDNYDIDTNGTPTLVKLYNDLRHAVIDIYGYPGYSSPEAAPWDISYKFFERDACYLADASFGPAEWKISYQIDPLGQAAEISPLDYWMSGATEYKCPDNQFPKHALLL